MTRLSWTTKRRHDKRNGSKRFLPRNTNGNGSIRTASNYQTTLYPNVQTTRTIIQAVANGKKILWINGPRTLYYNAAISPGATAGVMSTSTDGGVGFSPDFIVQQGVNGFAAAAQAAGLFNWNGLSNDVQDALAADAVWHGVTVQRGPVVVG